jgi:protein tyrosine phosphatase (PTP) superfamily phosphohydrolase (DUF442 family)
MLLGFLLAAAVQAFDVAVGGNVHVVIKGTVYRSAQPSPAELARLIRRYGIRTVVNLRGDNREEEWYWEEKRTTARHAVAMVDVGLYANSPAEADQLGLLVDALDHAPRPILLHCYSGGDRAGLASTLALLLGTDVDLREARGQMAWWLGHNPFGRAACHDRLLDRYAEWLRGGHHPHTPARLRHWVRTVYKPELCLPGAVCRR